MCGSTTTTSQQYINNTTTILANSFSHKLFSSKQPTAPHVSHLSTNTPAPNPVPETFPNQPAELAILPNKLFSTSHRSSTKNTSQSHQTIHASAKIIYHQYSPVYITQTSQNISRTPRTLPNLIQSSEQLGNRSSSEEEQASHKTQVVN